MPSTAAYQTAEAHRSNRDQRRNVQRTVLDARQRLTSSSGTRVSFDYDLLDDYASARLSGFLPTLLVIAILTSAAILWVSPNIAAIWAGFVLVANAGTAMLCRQFRRARAEAFNARRWTAIFTSAETINGLAWALMALLPIVDGGQDILIIIFAMLLVGVAVNAVSTRTLPRATLVSTLPPSVAVDAMLIWSGGTLNYARSCPCPRR